MRRIKYLMENSKTIVANLPLIKLLIFFKCEIYEGYKIYRDLKNEYGEQTKILFCPHTGTGDIYMIGRYFQAYLEKEHITKYTFLFRGKSEKKIGDLFNIKGNTILSEAETWKIIHFTQFINPSNIDLIELHHYHYAPQSHMHLEYFEGYKGITFNDMFRYVTLKLPANVKATAPEFKNTNRIESVFRSHNLIPGKTVILAPYSSSIKYIPLTVWENIAVSLKKMGYTVATNCVADKECPIAGTTPLSFEYNSSIFYLEYAGYFIGIRSGICDIISSAKCIKIVFYPMWDASLPWQGIPGKTLQFFGLNNNNLCDNTIEIEFDNESIKDLHLSVMNIFNKNSFDEKLIQLKQDLKPAFNSKTAIVIVFNEYFAPIASVHLQSIIEFSNSNSTYDIFLLNDGLDIRTKYMIMTAFRGRKNFSVRFIDYRYLLVNYSLHVERGYSPITYGRLVSPYLLQNFDKIIYLDSDTIMNCDIAELYEFELGKNLIAAVKDLIMIAWASIPDNVERININKRLKLSSPDNYINAGVLIINNKRFNEKFPVKKLLKLSITRQWRWMDQDILNKLCDGNILFLPQEYNVLSTILRDDAKILRTSKKPELIYEYQKAMENPKIIHFISCGFLYSTNPTRHFDKYWSIARKSAYYETMLHRSMTQQQMQPKIVEILERLVSLFRKRC